MGTSTASAAEELQGKDSQLAAQKFTKAQAPLWITAVAMPAVKASTEPYSTRLADTQFRWDSNGESLYVHYALTANNTGGLPQLGQLTFEFKPEYQSFQLHALKVWRAGVGIDKLNSAKIRFLERELGLEQSVYNGTATVAVLVDDIRVGDTVEYAYSVIGSNPVFKGIAAEEAGWEYGSPVTLRRVSIQYPVNRSMQYRFVGNNKSTLSVKPAESVKEGFRELIFQTTDVAPVRFEDNYPTGFQPYTWLQFSEYRNWNQVAMWASDLFDTSLPSSGEFKTKVAELQRITDLNKRAAAALTYVQTEIRYTSLSLGESSHRPAAPDEVLMRRFGDCKDKTLLLVSLYKAIGLDATPVILGVKSFNGLDEWLPSPAAFDHAIVRLDIKGKVFWVDPTAIQGGTNIQTIGHLHDDKDVLVAKPTTDKLLRIGPTKADSYIVNERVRMQSMDGLAILTKSQILSGASAEQVRWSVSQISKDQLEKDLLNEIQHDYGETQGANVVSVSDDREKNILTVTSTVTLKKYAEKTEGGWILRHKPKYIGSMLSIPQTPQRTTPLALQFPVKASFVHEVELPNNVAIKDKDSINSVHDTYFTVTQTVSKKGGTVSATYEYESFANAVPVSQVSGYVDDLRKAQADIYPYIFVGDDRVAWNSSGGTNDLDQLKSRAENGDANAQTTLGMRYAMGDGVLQDFSEAITWWQRAIKKNNAEAQFNLGLLYFLGKGVKQDYRIASEWFRKSADQKFTKGEYYLGLLYAKGWGVGQQMEFASQLFERAAAQGYGPAIHDLGVLYETGKGVLADPQHSTALFRKAAEQGYAPAQVVMGTRYLRGNTVPQSRSEALTWYRKAADQGDADGQFIVGLFYENGWEVQADLAQAASWYTKAADQGQARARFSLGLLYVRGTGVQPDPKRAFSLFLAAAEQGDADAQNAAGIAYEDGIGTEKNGLESVGWYRKAAEQGQSAAQFHLGYQYAIGIALKRDDAEAISWFRKSAEQGNPSAQNALGVCYEKGQGVPTDQRQSVEWYRKAAIQGNVIAQTNLGLKYASGSGVEQSNIKAHAWFNIAATKSYPEAKINRDLIAAKMTVEQVSAAQKLASKWQSQNLEGAE